MTIQEYDDHKTKTNDDGMMVSMAPHPRQNQNLQVIESKGLWYMSIKKEQEKDNDITASILMAMRRLEAGLLDFVVMGRYIISREMCQFKNGKFNKTEFRELAIASIYEEDIILITQ